MGACTSKPMDAGPTPMMLVLKVNISKVPGAVGQDAVEQVRTSLKQELLPGIKKQTKGLVRENGHHALEMKWYNGYTMSDDYEVVGHILVESNKLIEQSTGGGKTSNVAINVLDKIGQKNAKVAEEIQKAVEETLSRDLSSKSCGWVKLESCRVFDHDPDRPHANTDIYDHEQKSKDTEKHGHQEKNKHEHDKENNSHVDNHSKEKHSGHNMDKNGHKNDSR